jgi:hypothetical protein
MTTTKPLTILDEAAVVVDGDRATLYGHPRVNLTRIARLWSEILNHPVSAYEVGLCMIALKIARATTGSGVTRDTLIDIAGYARCLERLSEPCPTKTS